MSQVYSEQELYHLYNKFGASARSLAAYASDPECYESHVTQEITVMDPEAIRHTFSHPYSVDPHYIAIIEPSPTRHDTFETRVASQHIFELLWKVYRTHQRTSDVIDFCQLFQASPTTTARWASEIQVHEFLRRQQSIHLIPLVQDKPKVAKFIPNRYTGEKFVAIQFVGLEEYSYAKGDELHANPYYRPEPADFPTIDSFLLIPSYHFTPPILVVFHISWSAREWHASKTGLCRINGLPLPKNTCQYHVVVSPEKLSLSTLFFSRGEVRKKSSKEFQVFNYPITFTKTPTATMQSQWPSD